MHGQARLLTAAAAARGCLLVGLLVSAAVSPVASARSLAEVFAGAWCDARGMHVCSRQSGSQVPRRKVGTKGGVSSPSEDTLVFRKLSGNCRFAGRNKN